MPPISNALRILNLSFAFIEVAVESFGDLEAGSIRVRTPQRSVVGALFAYVFARNCPETLGLAASARLAQTQPARSDGRRYRPAFPVGLAVDMMEAERGRPFEPMVLEAMRAPVR